MQTLPKTKILATIGPSSWDNAVLLAMVQNGMSIARINCSFADFAEQERVTTQLRKLSPNITIMLDIMGNKIRVTGFEDDKILEEGQRIIVIGEHLEPEGMVQDSNTLIVRITHDSLAGEVNRGTKIIIDDGNIILKVENIVGDSVICKVQTGGILKKRKTVNIPGIHLNFPQLNNKDMEDINNAKKLGVEYVAASFVRDINDVQTYLDLLKDSQIKLIAKIENAEGVQNIDQILELVDGIMVARGDLGVEIPIEKVPFIQKDIVEKCRKLGKPVIVATQMLESMRNNPVPTRAEVSDISCAIFEGADAIMLSAETSTGKYPVEAVEVMKRVAFEVEKRLNPDILPTRTQADEITDTMLRSIAETTEDVNLKGIIFLTHSEKSVTSLTRHLVKIPVWTITTNPILSKQLNLIRGVTPFYVQDLPSDRDKMISQAVKFIFAQGEINLDDNIAIIGSSSVKSKDMNYLIEIVNVRKVLS